MASPKTLLLGREPWLAVNLSSLFPGLGQLYSGQFLWAGLLILGGLALMGAALWVFLSDNGNVGIAVLLALLVPVLALVSMIAAHIAIRQSNDPEFESDRTRHKDPWLAVFLARLLPGLGHFYLGQWLRGLLVLLGWILVIFLTGQFIPPVVDIFIGTAVAAAIAYYTYRSAPVRRNHSKITILVFCFFIVLSTLVSAGLAAGIRLHLAEARYIPSASMIPTLQPNDRVIVEKLSYQLGDPQRGDIVVFSPPEVLLQMNPDHQGTAFLMRVVGLPGEKLAVKEQKVFINDQPLDEPYIQEPPDYTWGPEVIPENSYFVLGDNRNNSFDSHFWGYVPRQNIIGRANKIFWPPDRMGPLNR